MNDRAELIRRNPDYVKKARQFKKKWNAHFKVFPCPNGWLPGDGLPLDERQNLWIFNSTKERFQKDICIVKNLPVLDWPKEHINPAHETHPKAEWVFCGYSEKLKTFLDRWGLTRFIDPDNLGNGTFADDTFFINEVAWCSGEDGGKYIYIQIRRDSKPSHVKKALAHMGKTYKVDYEGRMGRQARWNDPLLKEQLKIYDLRVANRRLSFSKIAEKVYRKMTTQSADRAKKTFAAIEARIQNSKSELS